MTIKVIATDMDGTLLDDRGQLDLPRLEKILDQLESKGAFVLSLRREMKSPHEATTGALGGSSGSSCCQWCSYF